MEEPENIEQNVDEQQPESAGGELHKTISLSGMYQNWFLDYASYVILERAVPDLNDGLKPVQRRILHAMKDLDDGRFNKVANIIGHTMKYHPHGDASIGEALVQLGQKDLLVETQGNWGNILTGDNAAAPRYIEARLSKFALEVVFNPKTTKWKASYDGRNKEPVSLPVKFPLLLAQGIEGIAVGLASKILPHNFIELIDASIKLLQGAEVEIYPDFPTGGLADASRYSKGLRGGRLTVRARISQVDKKTLAISEIPFGTTTGALIESILSANDKGKIRIRKIDDNTAGSVEILIHLAPGVSPDQTIDALYAFTDCQMTLSPNACVIHNGKPRFIDVNEILAFSVNHTKELLQMELEIRLNELKEQWHFETLEKIFIEKRIYRKMEECESWEEVVEAITKGLHPYKKKLGREITADDIVRLTEIRIKRISKYNADKAAESLTNIEMGIEEVNNHLDHLVDYTINYYRQIRKKYGQGRERRTELRSFESIEATLVAAANQKLYVNRDEGFAGTSLKKDEYVCDCSDIDDIIAFRADGTFIVTRVSPKSFIGHDIIYVNIYKKNDERTIYNVVYADGKKGVARVKRFPVVGVVRDKEYSITKGKEGSRILYFTANPNGEAEVIRVMLKPKPKLKKLAFEFDFSTLAIKGRNSQGNILTKHAVRKVGMHDEGISTLGALNIWYDDTVKRLNTDERGVLLGAFSGNDRILTIQQSGHFRLMNFDLSNHFDDDMIYIGKFSPETVISAIYFENSSVRYYLKRFMVDGSVTTGKKVDFLGEEPGNRLERISTDSLPRILIRFDNKEVRKPLEDLLIAAAEFIAVKSHKAKGKRLTDKKVKKVEFIEPIPVPPAEETPPEPVATTPVPEPEPEAKASPVIPEKKKRGRPPSKPAAAKPDGTTKPDKEKPDDKEKPLQMELDF
jgi:topoisomerase-4 subunit A